MIFAWQGWRLSVPDEWNPVKLHGSFDAGYALLSDIHRPRVGMRWTTPGKRFDSKAWARRVLVDEVGTLAADEAETSEAKDWRDGWLYVEPKPPGRDVWVATSVVSGRTIEIVHHVYEDEESKLDSVREDLRDSSRDAGLKWSVFDLSCRSAAGWRLESHRLNAGDLSLEFCQGRERVVVRQIAVAHLALKRMTIERWLEEQMSARMSRYRPMGEVARVTMNALEGVGRRFERRRQLLWNTGLPAKMVVMALHDAIRDRLVFVEAKDQAAAEEFARSVGWSAREVSCR
jgi:hypothetical protein